MFFYSVMNKNLWYEFAPILEDIGLINLAENITEMCVKQLGLSKSIKRKDHREDHTSDELMDNILTYGNFGRKHPEILLSSGERISTVIRNIRIKGFYSYWQDNGLATWKLLKKHPCLKPFAFIYGFLRFVVRGIKGIVKTGRIKEQITYVKDKMDYHRRIGI